MKKTFLSVSTLLFWVVFVNAQNSSPYWSLAGNSNATSSSKLGTTNAINLRLVTNNLERMRINTSGNVGIGTTSPSDKLHVNSALGANAFRAQVNGLTKLLVHAGGGVSIGANTPPPSNGLYVLGNVGIGTSSPAAKLHVNNNATDGTGIYSRGSAKGVYGYGDTYGVYGLASNTGVYGGAGIFGLYGTTTDGTGAYGRSGAGDGVEGYSEIGTGVVGRSDGGKGGYFYSGSNSAGIQAASKEGYAGIFDGSVSASHYYTTSDQSLKQNVQELGDAMTIIGKLKPQNYEFKNDEKFSSLHLPKGRHYGFMAQDLEQILPNLVSEAPRQLISIKPIVVLKQGTDGTPLPAVMKQNATEETVKIKAVNYVELIPIIVKGMQELNETKDKKINDLQKQIDEQQEQIDELKSLVQTITKQGGGITSNSRAFIKQNIPNPTGNNTVISYFIPYETRNAQVIITDMKGTVLKTINLAKGEGMVNIRSAELSTGIYNYTLYVNNSMIETRQMIIRK